MSRLALIGAVMNRTALALNLVLLLSIVAIVQVVDIAKANPIGSVPVPSIQISSPLPYVPFRYENSTVNLRIYVSMLTGSPQLSRISYSLDGGPLVHIEDFTVNTVTDISPDRTDYKFYVANATLENLYEGNHTIVAYAGDLSTSRFFTVNSHYAVTAINILSPTNQTYFDGVPLVFTVNGEIEEAQYYLYRGSYDAFEASFSGNTTLDLPLGKYAMFLYVTTEKGQGAASTFFSVRPSSISNSNNSEDSLLVPISMITIYVVSVVVGLLVYFKKRKK